ncbi:M28 family peptidase [Undibacterium cyanobacteriorum]|uniref:M28 family peptidase n=1 Tax=Undibacterium cyanobacteriorum TaxID=3073561 RepID=A0ABY9RG03_9BURK|nr:M28 family peptidase [Undibacterium sp. 20NA77.5]WMW79789.1 M28 family peptidase [Undibacterium sp. 20NA77.5]
MKLKRFSILFGVLGACVNLVWCSVAVAKQQDPQLFNAQKIDQAMRRFVKAPHPMASAEQKKYTQELKANLTKEGWEVQVQKFKTKIPNVSAEKLGGKDKKANPVKEVEGENLIAFLKGSERCLVMVGGHYDTKPYSNMKFLGANDGGSSTAAMLELARVTKQIRKDEATKSDAGRYMDCTLGLAFFDGEEATLAEWNDGERLVGVQDNIHGSRAFAEKLEKQFDGIAYNGLPIKAMLIIDMIGHKNQNLFITRGSHPQLAQKFLSQRTTTKISAVNLMIEDDHVPFVQMGVPVLHIIDWTNLNEWHTDKDTLDIISNQHIADFGNMLVRFLKQKR